MLNFVVLSQNSCEKFFSNFIKIFYFYLLLPDPEAASATDQPVLQNRRNDWTARTAMEYGSSRNARRFWSVGIPADIRRSPSCRESTVCNRRSANRTSSRDHPAPVPMLGAALALAAGRILLVPMEAFAGLKLEEMEEKQGKAWMS